MFLYNTLLLGQVWKEGRLTVGLLHQAQEPALCCLR
jgi:hypothetical protein